MVKWLSKEEVKKLRKHCRDQETLAKEHGRWYGIRDRALVEFLLGTGLRVSECRDTMIQDLYLDIKNGDPYIEVRTLKRKKQVTDIVTLDQELTKVLKQFLELMKQYKKSLDGKAYLFPGRDGKKAELNTLEKSVKKIFKEAGLPGYYSAHTLRHTHGFHVYEKEHNLKLVQIRLRHSSIASASVYVGVSDREQNRTINGLYK